MDDPGSTHVLILLRWLKDGPTGAIPISAEDCSLGVLQAVTREDAGDPAAIARLARWPLPAWAGHSSPARGGPRGWLVNEVFSACDRLLFWVKDVRGEPVGCIGIEVVHLRAGPVLLHGPVAEPSAPPLLLSRASETLRQWVDEALMLPAVAPPDATSPPGSKRSA